MTLLFNPSSLFYVVSLAMYLLFYFMELSDSVILNVYYLHKVANNLKKKTNIQGRMQANEKLRTRELGWNLNPFFF